MSSQPQQQHHNEEPHPAPHTTTTTAATTADHNSNKSKEAEEGEQHHSLLHKILHPFGDHHHHDDEKKKHHQEEEDKNKTIPLTEAYSPHSAQCHRARMNAHNNDISVENANAVNTNFAMSGEHIADDTPRQLKNRVIMHEQMPMHACGVRPDTTAQSVADCWKFAGTTSMY